MSATLTTLDIFINKQASKIWDAKRGTTAGEVQPEVWKVRLHSLPLGQWRYTFPQITCLLGPIPLSGVRSERGLGTRACVVHFLCGQQRVKLSTIISLKWGQGHHKRLARTLSVFLDNQVSAVLLDRDQLFRVKATNLAQHKITAPRSILHFKVKVKSRVIKF